MKNLKYLFAFLLGIGITVGVVLFINKLTQKNAPEMRNDYYIITNQIRKMNKMVAVEQDFSLMQNTKMTTELLGGLGPSISKKIITFTKTNVQVSYDLNKMQIEVDSTHRKLIINSLPTADIKITPSVEIQSIDDSFFNRINEQDLKRITENAKKEAIKSIDENKLRTDGRKQLMENLSQIFVLAKALNYTIIDNTKSIEMDKT